MEVFLSLIVKQSRPGNLKDSTSQYRNIIFAHKQSYCSIAKYQPVALKYSQQIALYECTKIQTAYLNNIRAHFGHRLKQILNILCQKKKLADEIRTKLDKSKSSKKAINKELREKVYDQCNKVKRAVEKKSVPDVEILNSIAKEKIKSILDCYPKNYTFQKDSIFYDVKAKPEYHYKSFFKIAELLASDDMKEFNCFPLRTTFIPSYITLDTKIANSHILNNKKQFTADRKLEIWGEVVDLKNVAFKNQGLIKFEGTIETDGIGVSVTRQNFPVSRKKSKDEDATAPTFKTEKSTNWPPQYIERLTKEKLTDTKGNCVLIDPGRRDILFCKHEDSTMNEKRVTTYTKMKRTKLSRHFRITQKSCMPEAVKVATEALSKTKSKTVNLQEFEVYLKERAIADKVLGPYYRNETEQVKMKYIDKEAQFKVNEKGDLYYSKLFVARIRGNLPQPLMQIPNSSMFPIYLTILLEQSHLRSRLLRSSQTRLNLIAAEDITNEQEQKEANTLLEPLLLLPFRKMKFSSKIYRDQDDLDLVKKLEHKFGKDSILIIGNWSASNVKHQEPTRNKGLIQMLQKNGFQVFLIDEYCTSSYCPHCESKCETSKPIPNPRPHKRNDNPVVTCHGLLRYVIS